MNALHIEDKETRQIALESMQILIRITPVHELGRYLQMDVDLTVLNILRNQDLDRHIKSLCIKIISNLSAADGYEDVVKVKPYLPQRLLDQGLMEFIMYTLKEFPNERITSDLFHTLLNLILDEQSQKQLPRIVTPEFIKVTLTYINASDNVVYALY